MTALVLVSALETSPNGCTMETALKIIQAPEAFNEVTYAMQAQAFITQTSFVRSRGEASAKILCLPGPPLIGTAAHEWGRQRASSMEPRE